MEVGTIGLDLAKNVFQAHGADATGAVIFESNCGATRCCRFSRDFRPARWRWRPAVARTIGRARSARQVIRFA